MRQRARNRLLAVLLVFLCAATAAIAEVMDKEPTTSEIWAAAFPLAVIAFAAGRIHPLLGLVLLLLPNTPFRMLGEVHDPFVGPAIRAEAGMEYVLHVYAANALDLLGYALGVALRRRQRSKRAQKPPIP